MRFHEAAVAQRRTRRQWLDRRKSGVDPGPCPIKISSVLRALQAAARGERDVTIALELDETVHVAVDEPLLTWTLGEVLQTVIVCSNRSPRVVLRCQAGEQGVSLEVEVEGAHETRCTDGSPIYDGEVRTVRRAVEALGGELYVECYPRGGYLFAFLFPPVQPRRPSSIPPASGVIRRGA